MFGIGWGELAIIAVVAMLVLGPERLPKYAADAGRLIRQLRRMAQDASVDLRAELGPEMADLDLRDLHPKRLVRDYLLTESGDEIPLGVGVEQDTAAGSYLPAVRRGPGPPLLAGEAPPYDSDAT